MIFSTHCPSLHRKLITRSIKSHLKPHISSSSHTSPPHIAPQHTHTRNSPFRAPLGQIVVIDIGKRFRLQRRHHRLRLLRFGAQFSQICYTATADGDSAIIVAGHRTTATIWPNGRAVDWPQIAGACGQAEPIVDAVGQPEGRIPEPFGRGQFFQSTATAAKHTVDPTHLTGLMQLLQIRRMQAEVAVVVVLWLLFLSSLGHVFAANGGHRFALLVAVWLVVVGFGFVPSNAVTGDTASSVATRCF